MEFTDAPLEPFGEKLLQMSLPTQLSLKTPLVFRMVKELKGRGCLPWTGSHRAELCLDEALTNAMVHGNKLDPDRKVHVTLCADARKWGVVIEDEGAGFKAEDIPDPDSADNLFRESGRGILLMKGYVDEMKYNGRGNRLFMTRHRQVEPEEAELRAAIESEEAASVPEGAADAGPVAISREGDVGIVQVLGARITEENVDAIRDAVNSLPGPRVVLDLGLVEFITSVGLSMLVGLYKSARQKNGGLVLASMQPSLQDIFESAHLLRLFKLAPNRHAAVAGLQKTA